MDLWCSPNLTFYIILSRVSVTHVGTETSKVACGHHKCLKFDDGKFSFDSQVTKIVPTILLSTWRLFAYTGQVLTFPSEGESVIGLRMAIDVPRFDSLKYKPRQCQDEIQ